MGYVNEFPHSRMFDSDLREILEMYNTVKGLPSDWSTFKEIMNTDWTELKNFIDTYFRELNVQNEISNKIDALVADGTMDAVIRPIFEVYNAEMKLLKARVDNLAKLKDGSTTGDAELADGKVDYTGYEHINIGEHIRQVTSQLSSEIGKLVNNNTITKNIGKNRFNEDTSTNGFLSSDGENVTPYEDWMTTDFIYVHDMKNLFVSADYNGSPNPLKMFYFTIYDADKKFIYQFNPMENPYEITDRVYYIRFSYHSNVTKIQVEDSTYATEYAPYVEYTVIGNLKWLGKKWAVVGDSLTHHNERSRFNYHDYIANSTGITVVNLGSSGKGYMNGGAEDAFYYRVRNVPTDSDVVTIFGSGNDLSHEIGNPTDTGTDTICGCVNTTIDNIINRIPTVSLGIVTPTPWAEYPPTAPNNKMEQYANAIIEICKMRSIPYLDLYHESNLRPWTEEGRNACYSKDDGGGVHPDERGHKLIAPRFKAFLEKLIL